ncbi:unnamed protein product [Effrenium voratum]|uniref:Uncharacterized protein n=1 Tax=Effrenium voratum TaxID=2562239 RepID=A0AA36J3A7_9DINO|nr:unnamed protein product [Effrenium voratum]CAJ1449119.1 unnamed protein product [Effrenium voratum]
MKVILSLAVLALCRAWECPAGYGKSSQCQDGLCDLQKPLKMQDDCKEGLDGEGCTCWPWAKSGRFLAADGAEAGPKSEAAAAQGDGECFPCKNACCRSWLFCLFDHCLVNCDQSFCPA